MRVGSGVILFQLAGFLTSALADFYFAKHTESLYDLSFPTPPCVRAGITRMCSKFAL